MEESRQVVKELYESLVGNTRLVGGQLTIEGFGAAEYEELFAEIVSSLIDVGLISDYEVFYIKWARSYYRKFLRDRNTVDGYCPQVEKSLDMQTVQEQLVTLRHYLMRRYYSRYSVK